MSLAEEVVAAAAAYAATDVDDIVVLSILFARGDDRPRDIVAGQYLGIAVLVAAGVAVGAGLAQLPEAVVRWLGLFPIGLGLWLLWRGDDDEAPGAGRLGVLGVAAVTIANGGDNIAVYAPYFGAGAAPVFTTLAVFAVGVALWCAAAAFLGRRPVFVRVVAWAGHRAVPFVLIGLGIYLITLA